ncbi:MAG: hypothetical protein ACRYFS_15640 [Janthinobacterium lividum]
MSETTALPTNGQSPTGENPFLATKKLWEQLRLPRHEHALPPVANANDVYKNTLSPLDKLAVSITDRVGSMGFFLAILVWTILWTSYNILASEVTGFALEII